MLIRTPAIALACAALSLLATACATSPTGQRQLRLFPDSQMVKMGATAFEEIKGQTPVSKDPAVLSYVRCVADQVAAQAAPGTVWEVQVFESEQVNAFALPGGKIGVYTGMLQVAKNQHQLAAVLGHEVSHVTASHGNARVSAAQATQVGLDLVSVVAGGTSPMRQQLMGLLGLGAQYGVLLPYGRGQETEADIIGLDLMARAGFDPRESVSLWRNMAARGGAKPPVFMSTHPSNEGRIAVLQQSMAKAMQHFDAAQSQGRRPSCG